MPEQQMVGADREACSSCAPFLVGTLVPSSYYDVDAIPATGRLGQQKRCVSARPRRPSRQNKTSNRFFFSDPVISEKPHYKVHRLSTLHNGEPADSTARCTSVRSMMNPAITYFY